MIHKHPPEARDDSCIHFSRWPHPVCSISHWSRLFLWTLSGWSCLSCHLSSLSSHMTSHPGCLRPPPVCPEETGCWSAWPLSDLSESHPAGHSHSFSGQTQSSDSRTSVCLLFFTCVDLRVCLAWRDFAFLWDSASSSLTGVRYDLHRSENNSKHRALK